MLRFTETVRRHDGPWGTVWTVTRTFAGDPRGCVLVLGCSADPAGPAFTASWNQRWSERADAPSVGWDVDFTDSRTRGVRHGIRMVHRETDPALLAADGVASLLRAAME